MELTDEQKLLILTEWNKRVSNPPSIPELIGLVFPECLDRDARSPEGRVIREFLASKSIKVKAVVLPTTNVPIGLTAEQKQYIENNASTMNSLEMARVLFSKATLHQSSTEAKAVFAFYNTLNKETKQTPDEESPQQDYRPPNTINRVCKKINRYVKGADLDPDKLSPKEKKFTESLLTFLFNGRFSHQMNLYSDETDRALFESTFVSYVWDKPDLTVEDLDLYIILASQKVENSRIQKTIGQLQEEQNRAINEDGRLSMPIVEAIKIASDDLNKNLIRQSALYKSLNQERSKRLDDRKGSVGTLLNIIEEVKNQDTRRQMAQAAEQKNNKLKGEIKRLNDLDEIIVRIYGLDEETILNG